jgi:polyisoprenoid-binding protein YceI
VQQGKNKYLGTFDLTIKATTQEVRFPVAVVVRGGEQYFTGSFTINRLDYQQGEESLVLANEVTVYLEVPATEP